MKEYVEFYAEIVLDPHWPIMAWLVEYSAVVYTLYQKGEPYDGMTAWQRLRGKEWKVSLPHFGEVIDFKRRTKYKLDARWETGVFLGVVLTSTEKIVGTDSGVYTVQSIHRKPVEDRWDGNLVKQIKGFPWLPNPGEYHPTLLKEPIVLRLSLIHI